MFGTILSCQLQIHVQLSCIVHIQKKEKEIVKIKDKIKFVDSKVD